MMIVTDFARRSNNGYFSNLFQGNRFRLSRFKVSKIDYKIISIGIAKAHARLSDSKSG